MRIVFDMQGAQGSNRDRGIGRYSLSLALAMARQRGDHEFVLAVNGLFPASIERIRAAFDGLLPQDNIRVWDAPGSVSFISRHGKRRRLATELLREAFIASLNPDLCHIASLFEGFSDDAVTSIGRLTEAFPISVTLHDLIPLVHRERLMVDHRARAWYDEKLQHLRAASLLLATSQSSRREAIEWLGFETRLIETVHCAADPRFRQLTVDPAVRAALLGRHGLSKPFVMYVGGDDSRKNMDGLIRAYARISPDLRKRHQLAIVCRLPDTRRDELVALAVGQGLSPNELVLTGDVSDDDLVGLYNACTLFVFPSLHEGFGLPVLEAMSCGAPVIGSNTTSIPEVIGYSDALFDPHSDASIAAKMSEMLADERLRAELARHGLQQSRKFSWDASAQGAIAAFERVHAERRQARTAPRARRPRLICVSPWPPDRSGIANYSAELLPELARHYDIELVTSKERAQRPPAGSSYRLHGPDWLRTNAKHSDRILYQFGNSVFHDFMHSLLADVPGIVVLHDFFLSGFFSDSERFLKRGPVWTKALYDSHGYAAVRDRFSVGDLADVVLKYPANFDVLRRASGVIVHSEHARELATHWYGDNLGRECALVPHLQALPVALDREAARIALGVPEDAFVVCCFGHLGELKLNGRLLDAWQASALAADERCHLVFVGECPDNRYGRAFQRTLRAFGDNARIRITGWNAPDDYHNYLSATDAAVQLRAHSRGETSGAVLDCLAYGLPTVVNACGSMAELRRDAVLMLSESFENAELVSALEALRRDGALRASLSASARNLIHASHDPRACAEAYAKAVEDFHSRAGPDVSRLVEAVAAQDVVPSRFERRRLAVAIARNQPGLAPARRLFVDVSELVKRDARSGIQRVTRNILLALLSAPPAGFRIEPVYATVGERGYHYARRFTLGLLDCPVDWLEDDLIDPHAGDVFLSLDLNQEVTVSQADTLADYRNFGVRVLHVLHDLLPVLRPEWFPADMKAAHARWLATIARYDGVVAISHTVASEFAAWLRIHGPRRLRPLGIGWWPLGADLDAPGSRESKQTDAGRVPSRMRLAPTFLVVGTLEPRKGYSQTLSAFELMWAAGTDINLVLVGKPGWMVDDLVQRLKRHPESGKRLFWLDGVGDDDLNAVYAAASCLLAPSEGEGFGLPLIEAARHGLPILARDLPVFREVAGDHAAYFNGLDAESLAAAIRGWLVAFRAGRHPHSDGIPWLTWEESALKLIDVILQDPWPITWSPTSTVDEASCAEAPVPPS